MVSLVYFAANAYGGSLLLQVFLLYLMISVATA
jgi:hypothetical protein